MPIAAVPLMSAFFAMGPLPAFTSQNTALRPIARSLKFVAFRQMGSFWPRLGITAQVNPLSETADVIVLGQASEEPTRKDV